MLARACLRAALLVPLLAPPLSRAAVAQTGAAPVDTALAREALADFAAACAADAGVLWGVPLCGPMILIDRPSRFAVANRRPPDVSFQPFGTLWAGRFPEGRYPVNTAFDWAGEEWSMAVLPLARTRFGRLQLLAHEAFHRIQDEAGFTALDLSSPHLDERDGRYWLRLELRALAAALESDGPAAAEAARDALLFRAAREQRYPGADSLEAALEQSEGLAEYTGVRLAGDHLGRTIAEAAALTRAFERRASYTRALGYGTGPALGLLLDRWAPGWQSRARVEPPARLLRDAVDATPPADAAAAAAAKAARYRGNEIAAEEDARALERSARLADYRRRFTEGRTLVLRQDNLMRSFDPNTLVPFPGGGTVYPTGNFSAEWGVLQVDDGGALVAADYREVRVEAPADLEGPVVRGPGWTLRLTDGWRLRADERGTVTAIPPS